jgi:hypothetical protein
VIIAWDSDREKIRKKKYDTKLMGKIRKNSEKTSPKCFATQRQKDLEMK